MKILGIETSCDETAAAVVADGTKILSSVVASQIDIHRQFGGVVPEVAARSHIEVILPVVEKALDDAFGGSGIRDKGSGLKKPNPKSIIPTSADPWSAIDGIAVTYGPGLPGALLVGVLTARTLALAKNVPLYAINHVEAHVYANWLVKPQPRFPLLALIVSGGHSQLVLFKNHLKYRVLGQTVDDAVGEAFDKVAKLLGLGFPGGPAIAQAAKAGNPQAYAFPKAHLPGALDFSFSGLKTAVLRHLQKLINQDYSFASYQIAPLLSSRQINDTAASFQEVAVQTLVQNLLKAYEAYHPKSVVIAGGVAANEELRRQLQAALPLPVTYPPVNLCTDNAAMIAACAYWHAQDKQAVNPLSLATSPSLVM